MRHRSNLTHLRFSRVLALCVQPFCPQKFEQGVVAFLRRWELEHESKWSPRHIFALATEPAAQ